MRRIYLNTAALGQPSAEVRAASNAAVDVLCRLGPASRESRRILWRGFAGEQEGIEWMNWRGYPGLAQDLAGLLGLGEDPDLAMVVTGSTSDALRLSLMALADSQHRALVVSSLEHPDEIRLARAYWGGPIKVLDLHDVLRGDVGEQEIISRTVGAVKGDDVLLLSHVTFEHGLVLPVREIAEAIRVAAPQARVVIDGAHGPGNVHIDLSDAPVDVYLGSGHKWLRASGVSGFLAVRNSTRNDLHARLGQRLVAGCMMRVGSPAAVREREDEPWLGWGIGSVNPAPHFGLQAAITADVGLRSGARLRGEFEDEVGRRWPDAIVGRDAALPRSGILTLRFDSWARRRYLDTATALEETHGVVVEVTPSDALRFSFTGAEQQDEIDLVLEALNAELPVR